MSETKQIDDGGSAAAFIPGHMTVSKHTNGAINSIHETIVQPISGGMTIRDMFATCALSGLLTGDAAADGFICDVVSADTVAKASYIIADAMLQARKS